MRRGKSKPGEKTLIDVLYPAAQALRETAQSTGNLTDSIARAYEAAQDGYERTKDLVAQHGRAAYYREQSSGKEDPGAAAALIIIQGMYEYISGNRQQEE